MAKKKTKKKIAKKKKTKPQSSQKTGEKKVLAPSIWRDSNGHFKKGNPGGPGRPFLREERFLSAISEQVTDDQWKSIIATAVVQALNGDRHARDWLSKWLLGIPQDLSSSERRTVLDVLTDGSFVKWIESGGTDHGA